MILKADGKGGVTGNMDKFVIRPRGLCYVLNKTHDFVRFLEK